VADPLPILRLTAAITCLSTLGVALAICAADQRSGALLGIGLGLLLGGAYFAGRLGEKLAQHRSRLWQDCGALAAAGLVLYLSALLIVNAVGS